VVEILENKQQTKDFNEKLNLFFKKKKNQKISHCILAVTGSSDNSEVTSNSCVSGFVEFLLDLQWRIYLFSVQNC
jgi:hypothetical protein